ncbi:hypothetical protein ACQ4PT_055264 [Festuca glaucescens]
MQGAKVAVSSSSWETAGALSTVEKVRRTVPRFPVQRRPRAGSWRGPCPPRRNTPLPVFGQFLLKAGWTPEDEVTSPACGSVRTLAEEESRGQFPSGGAHMHGVFSWAGLGETLRFLWVDHRRHVISGPASASIDSAASSSRHRIAIAALPHASSTPSSSRSASVGGAGSGSSSSPSPPSQASIFAASSSPRSPSPSSASPSLSGSARPCAAAAVAARGGCYRGWGHPGRPSFAEVAARLPVAMSGSRPPPRAPFQPPGGSRPGMVPPAAHHGYPAAVPRPQQPQFRPQPPPPGFVAPLGTRPTFLAQPLRHAAPQPQQPQQQYYAPQSISQQPQQLGVATQEQFRPAMGVQQPVQHQYAPAMPQPQPGVFAPGTAPKPKRNKKKKVVQPGVQGQSMPINAMQPQQVGAPFVQGQTPFIPAANGSYQPQFQAVLTTTTDMAAPVLSSSSRPPGRVVLPARGRVHTLARTSSGHFDALPRHPLRLHTCPRRSWALRMAGWPPTPLPFLPPASSRAEHQEGVSAFRTWRRRPPALYHCPPRPLLPSSALWPWQRLQQAGTPRLLPPGQRSDTG